MALALIGEAAVGALVEELLGAVWKLAGSVTCFKDTTRRLETTLQVLSNLIRQKEYQYSVLGCSDIERRRMEMIRAELEKGKELVSECLKVRGWWDPKKLRCGKKLKKLDESLNRILHLDIPAMAAMDLTAMMLEVKGIPLGGDCSADFTMGVVGMGNGTKKVIFKVDFRCQKDRSKALTNIVRLAGVESAALHEEKSEVSVIGACDWAELASLLRKEFRRVKLVPMGSPKRSIREWGTTRGGNQDLNSNLASTRCHRRACQP